MFLFFSLNFHYSTMFLTQAKLYSKHLKFCKISSKIKIRDNRHSNEFVKNGFCTFKNQKTEDIANEILKSIKKQEKNNQNIWDENGRYIAGDIVKKFPRLIELFDGEFKIFLIKFINQIFLYFTVFYTNQQTQVTNQQVHNCGYTDGGPGTCINVMFCLSEINENNGSMKCLPWHISKSILLKLFKNLMELIMKLS